MELKSVEAQPWNESVASYDYSKFYHVYEWGMLLREVHGHEPIYLRIDESVFPIACVKSRLFGKRLISLPFADYGGPCARDEDAAEKLIVQCKEKAEALGVDFIEVRSPHDRFFRCLEREGFVRRDEYVTFIIRLDKGSESVWKQMTHAKRTNVRKAQKSGVEVVEAQSKSDLKAFYQIYLKTMKRLGSPPQPYKYFDRIWDLFYPDVMRMPLARHEGEYIAGGLGFIHGDTIHLAYGCSLEEHLKIHPNELITWHSIQSATERGLKFVDLGRSRQGEGTTRFKKEWASEPVVMPYFYKFYGKKLDERQEIRYKWISRLWSKFVPAPVANKLGPFVIRQIG